MDRSQRRRFTYRLAEGENPTDKEASYDVLLDGQIVGNIRQGTSYDPWQGRGARGWYVGSRFYTSKREAAEAGMYRRAMRHQAQ